MIIQSFVEFSIPYPYQPKIPCIVCGSGLPTTNQEEINICLQLVCFHFHLKTWALIHFSSFYLKEWRTDRAQKILLYGAVIPKFKQDIMCLRARAFGELFTAIEKKNLSRNSSVLAKVSTKKKCTSAATRTSYFPLELSSAG